MKKIIVKWEDTRTIDPYDKQMGIVYSDHERFREGTRFDFGFLQIASNEGFIIEIYP